MNLTVGPLPPAVYWRRRALVLGVVLLLVILLVSMCGGSGGANKPRGDSTRSTTSPSPTPSDSSQPPILGGGGPGTGGTGGAGGTGGTGSSSPPPGSPAGAGAGAPAAGQSADASMCTDSEIQLTPSIQPIVGGTYPYQLVLKVRNTSTRTCKRDVGAGPQEVHITDTSGHVVWSSDYCQGKGGSDVRSFGPNIEDSFGPLGWDGYGYGPNCTKTGKLGPGNYDLVAKLGTKVSAAVGFTIKGSAAVGS